MNKDHRIRIFCVRCDKAFSMTAEDYRRYAEEHFSNTDHSESGYICAACYDSLAGQQGQARVKGGPKEER